MADTKTERQLNLLFLLLNSKKPVEREVIRNRVPGYFGKSNEAFERMFERDKDDLRGLNIPIETKTTDVLHEDNLGYLIDRSNWLSVDLDLTIAERAILNLASAAWQEAQMKSAFKDAAQRFGGESVEFNELKLTQANVGSAIQTILKAKAANVCVQFRYLSATSKTQDDRTVAPWRILLSDGSGYLIGFDQVKGEPRVFKLTRIVGEIHVSEEKQIETAPQNLVASDFINAWKSKSEPIAIVELSVRASSAGKLRAMASQVSFGKEFDEIVLHTNDIESLALEIAKNCSDVIVKSPRSLKVQVDHVLERASVNAK
jgi:proteasome accessory factor B